MEFTQYENGKALRFYIFNLILKFSKVYRLLDNRPKKLFLFQLNRFENGYVTIYFSFFFKYSLTISGIKLKEGKRYFLGNKQNY